MNAASSKSLGAANARTGSPLPSLVHRFLPSRVALFLISALAASRICAVRPVVLLELDQTHRRVRLREVALEMLHVGRVGAAERVDRLVVVADGEHRSIGAGQRLEPSILQRVRILELVDQQMREAPPIMLADAFVPRQQLVAAQQQLGEIDDAFALAHRLVQRVVLDLAARELVARLDGVRPPPLFLRGRDEPLQLARRVLLVVDAVRACTSA